MANKKQVTLYRKDQCVQCDATKRWLDQNGYKDEFEVGDAVENIDGIINLLGLKQAPVVRVTDPSTGTVTFWSGHNPIELEKHLKLPVAV